MNFKTVEELTYVHNEITMNILTTIKNVAKNRVIEIKNIKKLNISVQNNHLKG